jgi:hypothetical protein
LRAIRSYANTNTYTYINAGFDSYTHSKPNPDANSNALHGKMYTYPEAADDSAPSAVEPCCDHFHAEHTAVAYAVVSKKCAESYLASSDALGHRIHSTVSVFRILRSASES